MTFREQLATLGEKISVNKGRAPGHWRQCLRRHTARLRRLPRACTWLTSLTAVAPKLSRSPLLGDCLAEVTQEFGSKSQAASQSSVARHPALKPGPGQKPAPAQKSGQRYPGSGRPATAAPKGVHRKQRVRPPVPVEKVARTTSAVPFLEDPHSGQRTAAGVSNLNRKAPQSLLQRLAGEPSEHLPAIRAPRRPVLEQVEIKKPKEPQLPVPAKLLAQRDLLQNLTRRTERTLFRFGQGHNPTNKWPTVLSTVLVWQMTKPVKGETISEAYLQRLVTTGVRGEQQGQGRPQPNRDRSGVGGAQAGKPGLKYPLGEASPHFNEDMPPLPSNKTRQKQQPLGSPQTAPRPALDSVQNGGTNGAHHPASASTEPPIAPPMSAAGMPPLHVRDRPHLSDSTVGQTVIRQASHREEAESPEDLGELAGKLKQILDEQARRYGINV